MAVAAGLTLLVLVAGALILGRGRRTTEKNASGTVETDMVSEAVLTNDALTNDFYAEESQESDDEAQEGLRYHLTLRVKGSENTGEEIVYYGEVIASGEEGISAGDTVSFCIGDAALSEPQEGEIYTVTLEDITPYASEAHPYLLREILQ